MCVYLVPTESQPAGIEWRVAEAQGTQALCPSSLKGRMESRAAPSLGPVPAALSQPSALVNFSGHTEAKWSSRLQATYLGKGVSSQLAQPKAWTTLRDNLGACPF